MLIGKNQRLSLHEAVSAVDHSLPPMPYQEPTILQYIKDRPLSFRGRSLIIRKKKMYNGTCLKRSLWGGGGERAIGTQMV